jgi:membrane protease YdiL (CAAX protease family)
VYGVVTKVARAVGLPPMRGMEYEASGALQVALLLGSTAVTAAFCEEVFFRVLWIGALRERLPAFAAVAVSLVAFATIHYPYFGTGGVVFVTVWALLPIALFLRFGDVGASVTMHALNNAFAYVVVPLLLR